ncbi:hypothetical protein CBS101457_004878 [Exobasidium rhododendri]|nr:hypothetical protein CBS101457_004878 [Exobasidium rhododendri]
MLVLPSLSFTLLALTSLAPLARAACECGYLDPDTNALWTDATITYFNESGINDIVTRPAQSPRIYGQQIAGDTGTGQESWAIVGDHVNDYEDSFGATWRSAVSYNNTFIDDMSLGLGMQVSTPDLKDRIVNGSQIVTRRRDIQYGTFRASIQHAALSAEGAGFKFGVSYNESESIDMSVYLSDDNYNTSVWWSYSASGQDAAPRKFNYSWLDTDMNAPVEHKLDWLSNKRIGFGNNGNNETIASGTYVKGKNSTNLPSMAAPVSLQAWSNGEPSGSQGPPVFNPLVTRILYVRFFYNSTLDDRHTEFASQCAAVNSFSEAICSTDDLSLRNSTVFSLDALNRIVVVKAAYTSPLYAIIAFSVSLAIFISFALHALMLRRIQTKEKKKVAEAANLSKLNSPQSLHKDIEEDEEDWNKAYNSSAQSLMTKSSARSTLILPVPDLSREWDSDSDDDDELDSLEDCVPILGDLEGKNYVEDDNYQEDLPKFVMVKDNVASPPATVNRLSALRFDTSKSEPMSPGVHGLNFSNPFSDFEVSSSYPPETESSRYSASRFTPANDNIGNGVGGRQFMARPPAIVRWGKRHDGDEVGQLAQPRTSIMSTGTRRHSVMFAQQSLLQSIYSKIHDLLFIKNSGATTSTGEKRIDYLDGIRGFACLFVSVGHFFLIFYNGVANTNAPHHYPEFERWLRIILGPIVTNAGLVLGIFFCLPARTMCQRYLLKGGLQSLADSTVRRIPRLVIPVLGACLANYLMIDVNAYKWVPRLASRTWSNWSYFQNFENVLTFANAFITLWWAAPPASPALVTGYATGVLWTIPLIVQGMWTCMISALVAHELKTAWKRFTFYALCIALSWYANTWDMFFMCGLVIADLDANLHYREWAAKGIPVVLYPKLRIHGRWFAWTFFLACCAQQWISYYPNAPGSTFDLEEYGIHPNWRDAEPHYWDDTDSYAYVNPRVSSWFAVMSIFILADLSPNFQTFFRLRIWRFLGTHSMAYYLCHGIIFWTWGAWLCITMLTAGASYWSSILVVFITSYFWLTILCICFTYTFELWSIMFSKACWRAASSALGRKV